jgi:predicted enzyme related to lactoylglutathione lyase
MAIEHVFAGIPVAGFGTARAWYERLFGRAPDVNVAENEAMWQLATAGWVYVVEDPDRAGHALVTVLVDNLSDHLAALTARGITTGPIETIPGAAHMASITDPDGNKFTFGEALSPAE